MFSRLAPRNARALRTYLKDFQSLRIAKVTGDKDELTELFSVESESERKVAAAIELRAHTERDNALAARKRSMLQLLLDNKASLTSSQAGRLESALELALQEVCPDAPESPAAEDDDDATTGLLEFAAQGADEL